MGPSLPLTAAIVAQIAPTQTLADLLTEQHDFENDLHLLLHWLQPYYYVPNEPWKDALARTRAAARKCLKDNVAQLEFVRLYLASIGANFRAHFAPLAKTSLLVEVASHANNLMEYYGRQLAFLHLGAAAVEQFVCGLNALFVKYLLLERLLAELDEYLHATIFEQSSTLIKTLAGVGMGAAIQNIVVDITVDRICLHVAQTCVQVWSRPVLGPLQEWVRVELFPGFAQGCTDPVATSCSELVRIALDELVQLRVNEIYDLVAAYPESVLALGEIHSCLVFDNGTFHAQTQQRALLVEAFLNGCTARILHLGSNTVDVILTYIKTIKAFLLIDPTGVLLDKVARPIRRYLKSRSDVVFQLVRGMLNTDSASNPLIELAEELSKNCMPPSAPVDDLTDVNWVPDPIDALPDFKKSKVSDVVEALTSIFSLPSVFAEEFTRLFGERLLQWNDYNAEDILQHVELLKTRFGAAEFAVLDVMIKDVQDSNEIKPEGDFALTVLSKIYWPTVFESLSNNDTFVIPMEDKFKEYEENFANIRKGRKLSLVPHLGTVLLELEVGNEVKEFSVSPAQATVIELFHDEQDSLSGSTIKLCTQMSEYMVQQALNFWVKNGVLELADGKYKVIE